MTREEIVQSIISLTDLEVSRMVKDMEVTNQDHPKEIEKAIKEYIKTLPELFRVIPDSEIERIMKEQLAKTKKEDEERKKMEKEHNRQREAREIEERKKCRTRREEQEER